ncbi:hypothetical protein P3472_04650 [Vibrio parahaemolyticus]|nr:hypothetical protein [Vibrio parahaemolyticus]
MRSRIVAVAISTALISGCATQSPQTKPAEGAHSQAEQLKAQKEAIANLNQSPVLKRKVALGR